MMIKCEVLKFGGIFFLFSKLRIGVYLRSCFSRLWFLLWFYLVMNWFYEVKNCCLICKISVWLMRYVSSNNFLNNFVDGYILCGMIEVVFVKRKMIIIIIVFMSLWIDLCGLICCCFFFVFVCLYI